MFFRSFFLVGCVTFAFACGGDDGGGTVDPQTDVDAGAPDAAPAAEGQIGDVCDLPAGVCPEAVPACLGTEEGATKGFCSKDCGRTDTFTPMTTPPAGGNEECADGYTGDAQPVCAFAIPDDRMNPTGPATWFCGLACEYMGMSLGECPTGTTCQAANEDGSVKACFP